MANRNIDTEYFKGAFVRSLTLVSKLLYVYIKCRCSPAGIWVADLKIASAYLDQTVTDEDFREDFVLTGAAVPLFGGRYFFPDFIREQYPKGLSRTNPAHKNVIETLMQYGVLDELLNVKTKCITDGRQPLYIVSDIKTDGNGVVTEIVGAKKVEPVTDTPAQATVRKSRAKKAQALPKGEADPAKVAEMVERMEAFKETLKPFEDKYGLHMLYGEGEFFSYWTELNKNKISFRKEQHNAWSLSHRLATWFKGYKPPKDQQAQQQKPNALDKFNTIKYNG